MTVTRMLARAHVIPATMQRGRARVAAVITVLCLAAGCDNPLAAEFGEPDEQTRRDLAKCGEAPSDKLAAPPGSYIDQGLALDYARLQRDQDYAKQVIHDPRMFEQVYADAAGGNATARWSVCLWEAVSRGGGREAATLLAGLGCQTIASCSFQPDKLPYSDATASGVRILTLIADDFEAEAKRQQVAQEILGHMLALFVGTRVLSVRVRAGSATLSRSAGRQGASQATARTLTAAELAGVRGAGAVRSFDSFRAFKRTMGPAGKGKEWHHIVEKHEGNVARFGAREIHNTSNIIAIDAEIHRKVSGHYSRITEASEPLTVRQWLSGQSFEAQRAYGIKKLRELGAIP